MLPQYIQASLTSLTLCCVFEPIIRPVARCLRYTISFAIHGIASIIKPSRRPRRRLRWCGTTSPNPPPLSERPLARNGSQRCRNRRPSNRTLLSSSQISPRCRIASRNRLLWRLHHFFHLRRRYRQPRPGARSCRRFCLPRPLQLRVIARRCDCVLHSR